MQAKGYKLWDFSELLGGCEVGKEKKKKKRKKDPACKINCCNLKELTEPCLELTQIQTSVASKHIQGWCYSLAPSDWNSCWIVFSSYFYQHKGTSWFACFPLCQLTCNFCPSMIRVVGFLWVSSSISVSQHISPSLVHFKLFYVSTVQIMLFLFNKHIRNRIKSNFYWSKKLFHWQWVMSIFYRNEGKFLKALGPFCQEDMTFISHIPFLKYVI